MNHPEVSQNPHRSWTPVNGLNQEKVDVGKWSSQKLRQQEEQNPAEEVVVLVSRDTGNEVCSSGC